MTSPAVHVVLPGIVDDPRRPSGGSVYDDHVCRGLARYGWDVRRYIVRSDRPGPQECAEVSRVLAGVPARAPVLLDGLVASAVPEALEEHASRLRLVVLLHLPAADEPLPADAAGSADPAHVAERELRALRCARAVVVPSEATRRRVLADPRLAGLPVRVASPGVDRAAVTAATAAGDRLACVAAVTWRKGHDVLLEALGTVRDLRWSLVCAGPEDPDRGFAGLVRRRIVVSGLGGRVRMLGPLAPGAVAAVYGAADLVILPSRAEPYGMVVTEALARGVPVLGTAVDGLPEALGRAPSGERPGLLVPPGDPVALARALRRWLTEPQLRRRLRMTARARRGTLPGWGATTSAVAAALLQAGEAA
jgi:glycosyltransferase involved in cell wall biosynthesis